MTKKHLIAAALAASLFAGFATLHDEKCDLLLTAYAEQDELAGAWYDEAAKACEIPHATGCRGRDHNGFYNLEKKSCN